jgi:ketosteroid isomerase-like protein
LAEDLTGIVSSYFDAWRRHDPNALRTLLADEATFTGPLGQSANADEYRDAIGRMFAITTDIVIQKMLADDHDVLTWFELHTSVAPPTAVANWSRIENGKIVGVRPTFDPRAIIAARQDP